MEGPLVPHSPGGHRERDFHQSRGMVITMTVGAQGYVYIVSDYLHSDAKTVPDTASVHTGNDEIASIMRSKQQCDSSQFDLAGGVSDRYLHRLLCSVNTDRTTFGFVRFVYFFFIHPVL